MDWRIVFIGPMPTDTANHFDQMVDAVVAELRGHGYGSPRAESERLTRGTQVDSLVLVGPDEDQVTLIRPDALFSSSTVVDNVFDAIDDSDLVIADVSGLRPAVVYELAFAHALGIYTILLAPSTGDDLMFYLRGYPHAIVDFGQAEIGSPTFHAAIGAWLRQRDKRFDSANPFSDFYGAPLPDISAASGLATGYFENFLHPVLMSRSSLVDRTDGHERSRPVDGVVVVRPTTLRNPVELIDDTGRVLTEVFPGRVHRGEDGNVIVHTDRGQRTAHYVVDGWLIDVPRAVVSLEISPRLRRARPGHRGGTANERAHLHLTSVLIQRFLESAQSAVLQDRDILRAPERFAYCSLPELVDVLRGRLDRAG